MLGTQREMWNVNEVYCCFIGKENVERDQFLAKKRNERTEKKINKGKEDKYKTGQDKTTKEKKTYKTGQDKTGQDKTR
jgi:hypothetical protein